MKSLVAVIVVALSGVAFAQGKTSPGAGPSVVVVETEKLSKGLRRAHRYYGAAIQPDGACFHRTHRHCLCKGH